MVMNFEVIASVCFKLTIWYLFVLVYSVCNHDRDIFTFSQYNYTHHISTQFRQIFTTVRTEYQGLQVTIHQKSRTVGVININQMDTWEPFFLLNIQQFHSKHNSWFHPLLFHYELWTSCFAAGIRDESSIFERSEIN